MMKTRIMLEKEMLLGGDIVAGLTRMYWTDELSLPEISRKINLSTQTIYRWFNYLQISLRTISEAQSKHLRRAK